jgi:hypothetical protein
VVVIAGYYAPNTETRNASGKAANGSSPSRDGKATLSLEMSQRPVRSILIRLTSPKVGSAYTCLLPLRTLKWRAVVDALKALRLSQELVENVDTFSAKITGYCRSLEEVNKVTEAFMDSTMELFRYQVFAVFNQCDVNPQSTMRGTTSSPKQLALTVIFKEITLGTVMSHVVARSTCPAHWFPATREEEAHIDCATVAESPDHLRVSYPNNANDGQGVGNGGRSSGSGGDSLWKSETMTKFGREFVKMYRYG